MLEISFTQISSYGLALAIAAFLPGPGMIALMTKSLSSGTLSAFFMLFGLMLGDCIYLTIAVFGLNIISNTYLNIVIVWGGAFFLCYLAWQFWHYKPTALVITTQYALKNKSTYFFTGLFITLGNPKTFVFYLSILPMVVSLERMTLSIWAVVMLPVTLFILFFIGGCYIVMALSMKRLLEKEKYQQLLFKIAALFMGGSALSVICNL